MDPDYRHASTTGSVSGILRRQLVGYPARQSRDGEVVQAGRVWEARAK